MSSVFGPSPLQKLEQAGKKQPPKQPPPPPTRLHKSGVAIPEQSPAQPSAQSPAPTKPVAPYRPGYGPGASGPPINSLIRAKNFFGDINTVNQRTQAVHDAYTQAYGKPPSPGLTLDVVASPVPTEHFNALFSVPQDPFAAKSLGVVNEYKASRGLTPDQPLPDPGSDVIDALSHVQTRDDFNRVVDEHGDELHSLIDGGNKKVLAAYTEAQARSIHGQILGTQQGAQKVMSFVPKPGTFLSGLERVTGDSVRAASQIEMGLVLGPPLLVKAETEGAIKSVKEKSFTPFAQTNANLAKQVVKGTRQDIADPEQNAGNLLLDIYGVTSLGVGTGARVAAAGKALSEGAGAGAVARALLTRTATGSYHLGEGADVPLSSNPLAATVQRMILSRRVEGLNVEAAPAGAAESALSQQAESLASRLFDPLKRNFSIQNKVGRQLRASDRVERAARLSMVEPLVKATGSAKNTSLVIRRLGVPRWRALNVGEQKALQVLATDDPTPLQTWRNFHENLIEEGVGDPAAHRAHLAALQQAEKMLRDPSPRFKQALRSLYDVMNEQTQLRIDKLGLTPESAEARVARLGSVLRGEEEAATERVNPHSFYLLFQSLAKRRRVPTTFFGPRVGDYGMPLPDGLPETSHYFSGDAIRAGDFRIDTTRVATETYARTVRSAMKLDAWKRLHDFYATDTPKSEFDVPIRSSKAITPELRALIAKADNGQVLTAEDVDGLHSQAIEDLGRYLLPHEDDVKARPEDFKWVDSRYMASEPRAGRPSPAVRVFSVANEPLRDLTLFVRPGYALNLINNASMAAMSQGVFLVPNLVRAATTPADIGRWLDALAGEGHSLSYAPDVNGLTRLSRTMAKGWNKVTDQYFRRSQVIFYLRKKGFRTEEQLRQLRDAYLRSDENAKQIVTEASQRAKKDMVELDNLTAFEKNVLRHVIFVYPWQSRSAIWSLRAIVDHPAQAAIMAEIAHEDHDQLDPVLSRLPGWMKDLGYIPIGWNKDGSPKVINPGSVNTFSTLGEMAGIARGDSVFTDLLGPGADLVVRVATNRDRFGRAYKTPYLDPVMDTLTGLPQFATVKRAQQKEPATKPLDVTNSQALVEREHADTKRPIFVPGGFWNVYGPLIASGMDPRTVDPRAVEARWWKSQPWEKRHQHEAQLVQKMAGIQGQVIGRDVPQAVRDALTLTSARTAAYHEFAQEHGRTPNMHDRTAIDIETLLARGRLTDAEAKTLRANLKTVAPDNLDTFRTALLDKYAGGKALADWHSAVATVARFTPENVAAQTEVLRHLNLAQGAPAYLDVPTADLRELGRQYLAYSDQVKAQTKALQGLHGRARAQAEADLSAFVDEHDKVVKIGNRVFPSLARFDIARMSDAQRQQTIRGLAQRDWRSLSTLDKALLGRPVDPVVSRAWEQLSLWMAEARQRLKPGQSLPADTESYYAGLIAKQVPAFKRDYAFAQLPMAARLQRFPQLAPTDNRDLWNELLSAAVGRFKGMHAQGWSRTAISDYWRTEDLPKVEAWLDEHPSFKREVDSMGKDFVWNLVG